MTETVLETLTLPDSAIAAMDEAVDDFVARDQAMHRRVAEALKKAPTVLYSAYDCVDDLPVDNLDDIAIHGRCRFEHPHDDFWGDGQDYRSEEIVDPTWLQVACLADAMIHTTGDHHHVFLESVQRVRHDESGVMVYRFLMGS